MMRRIPEPRADHTKAHSALVKAILLALGQLDGVLAFPVTNWTGRKDDLRWIAAGAPRGCPDILACARGAFVGLEVKTGAGKRTTAQVEFAAWIERAGGVAVVVGSVGAAVAVVEQSLEGLP